VVARDGIEPPTPAFSGPRSTTELSGLRENFTVQFCARDSGVAGGGVQVPRNTALKTTSDSIATPIPGAKPGGPLESRRSLRVYWQWRLSQRPYGTHTFFGCCPSIPSAGADSILGYYRWLLTGAGSSRLDMADIYCESFTNTKSFGPPS
jgi:hypothetical protein